MSEIKTTLESFPFKGKSSDYPPSDLKAALEWKENFEKALTSKIEVVQNSLMFIEHKNDLIHNSMKLIASTEINLLEEILGKKVKINPAKIVEKAVPK